MGGERVWRKKEGQTDQTHRPTHKGREEEEETKTKKQTTTDTHLLGLANIKGRQKPR